MNTLRASFTTNCVPFTICLLLMFSLEQAFAQKQYTTISKNINPEAQGLYHDLSPQGDSLYLGAQSIFYKVTMLNSVDKKVFTFNPPVLKASIPLHDIVVGDYTVMVYKKDRIIVFHISRLLEITPSNIPNNEPLPLIATIDSIEIPSHKKSSKRERRVVNLQSNDIQLDDSFDLGMKEIKYAISDYQPIGMDDSKVSSPKPYNLSSMNRKNVQSRDDFRRNNVRPNGNPY